MRKQGTWIDNLDTNIIPYIDGEGYETRYPTLSPLYMKFDEEYKLRKTSRILMEALSGLVESIRADKDFPIDVLNMTPELTPFIKDDNSPIVSHIARLDFVKDKDGNFKLVEINADTPCAIPETFYASRVATDYFEGANYEQTFATPLHAVWFDLIKKGYTSFAFAANPDYVEDWANMQFVKNTAEECLWAEFKDQTEFSCVALPLSDLQITGDGVYTPDGTRIEVLYRLHPLELLVEDESDDGYPVGKKLMDLANMGKVYLVNPIKAILLQNKALMALAWHALNNTTLFSDDVYETLKQGLTPTYLDAEELKGKKFIKKPIFGREGAGVEIIDDTGKCTYRSEDSDLDDHVYQEFIPSDPVTVETDAGIWEGKLTYSCFVINGSASRPFVRFSPYDIAGIEALFVPVIVKD